MKACKAFPGSLSPELKAALGMGELTPPPWLINMQRYGPPPSYPSLKIPGLNAPIPPGTEFGYHPGGWGKPPVDPSGQPLYGDVFGVNLEPDDDLDIEVRLSAVVVRGVALRSACIEWHASLLVKTRTICFAAAGLPEHVVNLYLCCGRGVGCAALLSTGALSRVQS